MQVLGKHVCEAHQTRVTHMQNLVSSGYLVGLPCLKAHKRGHQFRTCSLGNWVGSMFEADQGRGVLMTNVQNL